MRTKRGDPGQHGGRASAPRGRVEVAVGAIESEAGMGGAQPGGGELEYAWLAAEREDAPP